MTKPEEIAISRIKLAMRITGLDATPLAKSAGMAGTTLSRLLSGKATSVPSTRSMMKLDEAVAQHVRSNQATPEQIALYEKEYVKGARVTLSDIQQLDPSEIETTNIERSFFSDYFSDPRTIPVLGTAAGSALGAFEIGSEVIDHVRRPPALAGIKDIYGIYVVGESMVPEHNPGDLRIIHPHRPARPGDSVIIQTYNAATDTREAFIKRLISINSHQVVCYQHNPHLEISYTRPNGDPHNNDSTETYAAQIHKVLTVNELHGF